MATSSFSNEREQLDEKLCKRVSFTENKLQKQKEIICHWPNVNERMRESCQRLLYDYGWPTNKKKQSWVDNPTIEQEEHPGRWRLARAYADKKDFPGVIAVLRYGFAKAISWDEAMLAGGDDLQEDERYREVIFRNVDPDHVEDMIAALVETTVDPVIAGKKLTGTWENIHKRPQKFDDGSAAIVLVLAQPQYTFTTYESYGTPEQKEVIHAQNVPKRLANSIIAGYTTTGDSGSGGFSTQEGVVDLIFRRENRDHVTILNVRTRQGALEKEYTDFYYNYSKNEVRDFNLGTVPTGWIYDAPQIQYSGGGLWNIRRVRTQGVAVAKSAFTSEKDKSGSTLTTVKQNQTSVPSLSGGPTQGVLRRLIARLNPFALWDTRQDDRTSTAGEETFMITNMNGDTETHYIAWNQRNVSMPNITSVQAHRLSGFTRHVDGTFSWHVVVVPRDDGLGMGSTAWYTVGDIRYRTVFNAEDDVYIRQVKETTYYIDIKQVGSLAAAITWAHSGNWCRTWPYAKLGTNKYLGFKTLGQVSAWEEE